MTNPKLKEVTFEEARAYVESQPDGVGLVYVNPSRQSGGLPDEILPLYMNIDGKYLSSHGIDQNNYERDCRWCWDYEEAPYYLPITTKRKDKREPTYNRGDDSLTIDKINDRPIEEVKQEIKDLRTKANKLQGLVTSHRRLFKL